MLLEFVQNLLSNFYIDFANRTGSYQVLAETLQKVVIAAAPILIFTSQESHQYLNQSWYAKEKGLTVFDEVWDKQYDMNLPLSNLSNANKNLTEILSQFRLRECFKDLLEFRTRL